MLKVLGIVVLSVVSLGCVWHIGDAVLDYQIATMDQQVAPPKAPVPPRFVQPAQAPRVTPPVVQQNPGVCDERCKQRLVVFI